MLYLEIVTDARCLRGAYFFSCYITFSFDTNNSLVFHKNDCYFNILFICDTSNPSL